jgi:Leucine-rich repeat (LRR) protein
MAHDEAYKIAERQIQQALRLHETRLSLNGIGLSELPESIGQLAHLTDLHLGSEYVGDFFVKQYNHLTALPPAITQLEHLEYLNLE